MASINGPRGMITTRTPLRVSFAGGGTDLPDFYERQPGAVLSTAINQYVYVTVKKHGELFGEKIRLNYSETETVGSIEQLRNDIARECLRYLEVEPPIYISTVADLPASTGLGSSSSFAVGLLHALHVLRGERVSDGQLAREACHIEIEVLKKPIGRQDQYASAYGGLNYFTFQPGGEVSLQPQHLPRERIDELFDHLMLFWTGLKRDSSEVLREQKSNTAGKMSQLLVMKDQALQLRDMLRDGFQPQAFGQVLDQGWRLKRQLASTITNGRIDEWYQQAVTAGAHGGKLLGAGGGGFLLFVVESDAREAVRRALPELGEVPIRYEAQGSRLLLPSIE